MNTKAVHWYWNARNCDAEDGCVVLEKFAPPLPVTEHLRETLSSLTDDQEAIDDVMEELGGQRGVDDIHIPIADLPTVIALLKELEP